MNKNKQTETKKPKKTTKRKAITAAEAAELLDDAGDDKEGLIKPSKRPYQDLSDVVDTLAIALMAHMNVNDAAGLGLEDPLFHTIFDARRKLRSVQRTLSERSFAMHERNRKDAAVFGRDLGGVDNRLSAITNASELLHWALIGHLDHEMTEPFLIPLTEIDTAVKEARAKLALEAA